MGQYCGCEKDDEDSKTMDVKNKNKNAPVPKPLLNGKYLFLDTTQLIRDRSS